MRVLNFIRTLDPKGGGPMEAIRSMSVTFQTLGSSNEVLTLDGPDAPWLKDYPVPVHPIDGGRRKFGYSCGAVDWLRRHAGKFDAVITHGIWNYPALATWRCLRNTATPWFIVPHGSLDPWFQTAFPSKHVKKVLYWKAVAHRIMADAAGVLFTSEDELRRARRSFHPYKCRELRVEYGVLNPPGNPAEQREAFFDRFPELREKRLIISMGRIVAQKGCDVSIRAFASAAHRDPRLQLVFAGPDQIGWKSQLERDAAGLGIADRISWTGSLSGDLKWGALQASEAFILPSHMENFGLAVAEALASGLPVLISENVQIWREIINDGAGLVSQNSVEGTSRMLEQWLDLEPRTRQEMRTRARNCFEARFEIAKAAESWLRAIQAPAPPSRSETREFRTPACA